MGAYIKAISYYLPERVVTNEDLVKEFPEWDVEKVYSKVGVNERHLAGEAETAGDLAEKAALRLFEEYQVSPSDIDFLLLCTQSPDYRLPSTACILQDRLGIPTSAGAFDYDLGCSGCIYGMAVAKGLIAAGLASNVLLLTAETYTKYLHPDDKSNRTIFGDGAAACLIAKEKGLAEIGDFVFGTDGSGADNLMVKTQGSRFPERTGSSIEDDDGHVNREDYLYMNGSAIFNFTLEKVPPMMNQLLEKSGLEKDDIDYYVFHQANKYMLSTLRKICGISKDKFHIDLEHTGNTVSSTILISLKDCLDQSLIQPGMKVMASGFGVGLSYGGTLLAF
jgi:3-oxoacyl-[acyl-carrier-protein] synthase-3